MATRIFELARELGVTSKTMLEKCRAEGLDIKNHMSTLSAGLEATLREWFSAAEDAHTAVETAEHVDLEQARREARRRRRHAAKEKEAAEAEAKKAQEAAEQAAAEQAEPQQEAAEAGPAEPTEPAEPQPDVAVAEPPAEVAEPETPDAPAEAPEAPEAPEAEPAESAVALAAETTEPVEEAPPTPEEPEPEPEPEPAKQEIKPAGPQVVPRPAKLQGPRVVRVEQPEYVDHRRGRRPGSTPRMGVGPRVVGGGQGEAGSAPPARRGAGGRGGDEDKRKGKRRSPRRRAGSGRSAEGVTDKLQEWRERDLQERSARLAAAAGGGLRRHRASVGRKGGGQMQPHVKVGKVEIDEPISVKSLSAATGLKAAAIIRKLMELGTLVTANQNLSVELAEMAVADYEIQLEVRREQTAEMQLAERLDARPTGDTVPRAPVVTFLGHVDHGKTSLLDHIRKTAVAEGEAGGITQHIGSYRYDVGDRHVVFLDTPGHEAFTAMRARGANMTDVVVLVVAADDGVMPQTVEAINHAKAAGVPIVVALNKVDLPNANTQRAMAQLAEQELSPRQWGGSVEVIETSAATGQGIEELVELLSLEAELLELKAEPDAPASGYVIESEMDPARGALARLLITNGQLKLGDVVLAGSSYGRVRQIIDDQGKEVDAAGPSTPVEAAGLDGVAEAGDQFFVVPDIEQARAAAEDRRERQRTRQLSSGPKATLESLLSQIEQGETTEVPLIIKADVQGSIEALTGSLEKLSTSEAKVNVLHTAVGGITTGDVTLAEASGALIIGFNAVPDTAARQLSEEKGVDIRVYRVIYDIVDDVRKALEEGLAPEIREEISGRAEVRQVFKVSRIGTIAGCYVLDGTVNRNARVRVIRNNIVVMDERSLESLKRFKDDVREVRSGMECGLKVAGFDDIKESDVLEFYKTVEVARTL